MKSIRTMLILGATTLALAPVSVVAQEENGGWHFDASVNLYMAGISGDLGAQGRSAEIDSDMFDDFFDHLTASIAGRFEARKDNWFGAVEISFMNFEGDGDVADGEASQWMIEPTVGYKFFPYLRAFGGFRFRDVDNELELNSGAATFSEDKSWIDPIIGVDLMFPIRDNKWTIKGHFDIGGFGVGSDFTWQAYPYVDWRFWRDASLQFGYRWVGTDFDDDGFRYDVISHGPQVGVTWTF